MALVDRAARKVTPQLRARFLQLVEKAESRGEAKVAKRLAKIADKNGDEALSLIAKFHQTKIPAQAPKVVNPLEKFPLFYKNETYVNDLIAGKTPLQGRRLLQEIQAHTDATSGTHNMAKAIEALSERLPKQNVNQAATKGFGYYAEANVLTGSLELAETEVAAKTAQTIGRMVVLSRDELKAATELLKGMKGVTDGALRHLGNAEEQVAGLAPKLMKAPGPVGRLFGAGPKPDLAIDHQIKEAYRQGIARVAEMTVPKAAAPVGPTPISPEKLLEDLLNHKINKTEEWKLFSSETWMKFQESTSQSSNGRISGSSASSGVNLLFAKAQEANFAGSIGQSGVSKSEGKLLKAIDLPIPNTDAHAPMVTVRHILQNKGDYILVSGGKLHAVNSADVDGFFHIAEKEVRAGASLFNAVK